MSGHRIHIFGASGSGTSTLGRALSTELATQHFDTDDFYWLPTDPPFRQKREIPDRVALMRDMFLPRQSWVLSGSIDSWSEGIAEHFTLAVLLSLDPAVRRTRLEERERRRHGAAMDEGGAAYEETQAFLRWSDGYEAGLRPGRSRPRHLAWAETLSCPVLHLDSAEGVGVLVPRIIAALDPAPQQA